MNNSSPLLQISKDAFRYLPAEIIPALVAFFGITIYTRFLKPEEYGLYALVLTTVSIISSIFFSWLNDSTLRYFERYKQQNNLSTFISTGLFSLLSLFLAVAIVWYLTTIFLEGHLDFQLIYLLRIGILVLGAQTGYAWLLTILRVNRKSLRYSLYSCIESVGRLALAVLLLYLLPIGPAALLWAVFVVAGGIFCLEVVKILRKWKIHSRLFSWNAFYQFAKYGIPLIGVSAGALILSVSDRYMIQYFLGSAQVGIYSVGYQISESSIKLFFSILMLAAFPIIIRTFETQGEKKTSLVLTKISSVYFIFLFPAVLGITILAKDIVMIMLGESFQEAFKIFPLITGGVFCLGLAQYFNKPFEIKERTKTLLYILIVVALLNIILNFFWIPAFGVIGAAWATFVSYIFYLMISWIKNRKWFIFSLIRKSIIKSILASSIMCMVLMLLLQNIPVNIFTLLLKIFLGVVIYLLVLFLLKEDNLLKILRYLRLIFKKT